MHDVLAMRQELQRMQRKVEALEGQLQQFRRARSGAMDLFRQVRWAETCTPTVGDYPDQAVQPTVFPIRFLDAHFAAAVGAQNLETSARQSGQITTCYSATYLANGTKLPVFWCRGLGEDGDEGEWFAFPQTFDTQEVDGIPIVNDDDVELTPWQAMAAVDAIDIGGTVHLKVRRPGSTFNTLWIVNGGSTIPPYPGFGDLSTYTSRGFWRVEQSGPVAIPADFSDVLLPGYELGVGVDPPFSNSGWLRRFTPGFLAMSAPYTLGGVKVVECRQRPVTTLIGKTRTRVTQNASLTTEVDIDIWHRGVDSKMRRSGFDAIHAFLPYVPKGDVVDADTWCRIDWYSHYWEADVACDKDNSDLAQQGGGQQGGGQGDGGGGQQQLLALLSGGSTGIGTGTN